MLVLNPANPADATALWTLLRDQQQLAGQSMLRLQAGRVYPLNYNGQTHDVILFNSIYEFRSGKMAVERCLRFAVLEESILGEGGCGRVRPVKGILKIDPTDIQGFRFKTKDLVLKEALLSEATAHVRSRQSDLYHGEQAVSACSTLLRAKYPIVSIQDNEHLYFMMARQPGTSLDRIVSDLNEKRIVAPAIRRLQWTIACINAYKEQVQSFRIDRKPVIHRDIKPANMMIDSQGRIRIIDFGFAVLGNPILRREFAGSPLYSDPRNVHLFHLMRQNPVYSSIAYKYDQDSDAYGLAVSLTEIWGCGHQRDQIRAMADLDEANRHFSLDGFDSSAFLPGDVDIMEKVRHILVALTRYDPQDRMPMDDALAQFERLYALCLDRQNHLIGNFFVPAFDPANYPLLAGLIGFVPGIRLDENQHNQIDWQRLAEELAPDLGRMPEYNISLLPRQQIDFSRLPLGPVLRPGHITRERLERLLEWGMVLENDHLRQWLAAPFMTKPKCRAEWLEIARLMVQRLPAAQAIIPFAETKSVYTQLCIAWFLHDTSITAGDVEYLLQNHERLTQAHINLYNRFKHSRFVYIQGLADALARHFYQFSLPRLQLLLVDQEYEHFKLLLDLLDQMEISLHLAASPPPDADAAHRYSHRQLMRNFVAALSGELHHFETIQTDGLQGLYQSLKTMQSRFDLVEKIINDLAPLQPRFTADIDRAFAGLETVFANKDGAVFNAWVDQINPLAEDGYYLRELQKLKTALANHDYHPWLMTALDGLSESYTLGEARSRLNILNNRVNSTEFDKLNKHCANVDRQLGRLAETERLEWVANLQLAIQDYLGGWRDYRSLNKLIEVCLRNTAHRPAGFCVGPGFFSVNGTYEPNPVTRLLIL